MGTTGNRCRSVYQVAQAPHMEPTMMEDAKASLPLASDTVVKKPEERRVQNRY